METGNANVMAAKSGFSGENAYIGMASAASGSVSAKGSGSEISAPSSPFGNSNSSASTSKTSGQQCYNCTRLCPEYKLTKFRDRLPLSSIPNQNQNGCGLESSSILSSANPNSVEDAPITVEEVLEEIYKLPVEIWNYSTVSESDPSLCPYCTELLATIYRPFREFRQLAIKFKSAMAFHMDKIRIKPEADEMDYDDDEDDIPDANFACEAVYNTDLQSTGTGGSDYCSDGSSSFFGNAASSCINISPYVVVPEQTTPVKRGRGRPRTIFPSNSGTSPRTTYASPSPPPATITPLSSLRKWKCVYCLKRFSENFILFAHNKEVHPNEDPEGGLFPSDQNVTASSTPETPPSNCLRNTLPPIAAGTEIVMRTMRPRSTPRMKTYHEYSLVHTFHDTDSALAAVRTERIWRQRGTTTTAEGRKMYYDCKFARSCPVKQFIIWEHRSNLIKCFRTSKDHTHELREKGLPMALRAIVDELFARGTRKPLMVVRALEERGIPEPHKGQLRTYLQALRMRRNLANNDNEGSDSEGEPDNNGTQFHGSTSSQGSSYASSSAVGLPFSL